MSISHIGFLRLVAASSLYLGQVVSANAQVANPAASAPVPAQLAIHPEASKRADAFLSTLTPPTTMAGLQSGNDLLLEFPSIAAAGVVPVRMLSTIVRTDHMWLISLSKNIDGPSALMAGIQLEPAAVPEATLHMDFQHTQSMLMVVRAAGKYYGVQRQIKIGQPLAPVRKK